MKKIILLFIFLFLLVGCSNEKENNYMTNDESLNEEKVENEVLKNPVIEWCQVYNPNGYNTVTCFLSNPNNVDIDISYDLVYYKDGKEVFRTDEKWSNYQISPKHKEIIWGNYDIPSAEDVDDIKMENIIVTKSYYDSIDAEVKYLKEVEDKAYFSVKNSRTPIINNIWILEYNDDNKNNKCDKGELVVAITKSVTEKETEISIDTDVYEHNAYDIYYNAY